MKVYESPIEVSHWTAWDVGLTKSSARCRCGWTCEVVLDIGASREDWARAVEEHEAKHATEVS